MPTKRKRLKNYRIGLVDADLLDNGTRHPNLVLLKIAGYLHDNGVFFELITTPDADISQYDLIYMSTVFTYTKKPKFYEMAYDKEKIRSFVVEALVNTLMKLMCHVSKNFVPQICIN